MVVCWAVGSWPDQPGVVVPDLPGSSSHRWALDLRNTVPALPPTDEWHDVSFQFSEGPPGPSPMGWMDGWMDGWEQWLAGSMNGVDACVGGCAGSLHPSTTY